MVNNQKSLESILQTKLNTINSNNVHKFNDTSHMTESIIDNKSYIMDNNNNNNRMFTINESNSNSMDMIHSYDYKQFTIETVNCVKSDIDILLHKLKSNNTCLFILLIIFNIILIGVNDFVLFYFTNITWN
jgi:hypothetical protein